MDFLLRLRMDSMTEHLLKAGINLETSDHLERVRYHFDETEIILLDGKMIGMLKTIETANETKIVQFQVDPEFQGRGLGRAVLSGLVKKSLKKELKVTLSVLKENRAKELYLNLGFKIVNENEHSFEMERCKTL